MSDIYLAISETPTVVTLTNAVINSAVASSVTVTNTVTVSLSSVPTHAITGTVTVGSLPAISGTVTANLGYSSVYDDGGDSLKINISAYDGSTPQAVTDTNGLPVKILAGTVTVGSGVVTVSNIQTVTAGSPLINTTKYPTALVGYDGPNGTWQAIPLSDDEGYARGVIVGNSSGVFRQDNPLPISGTVTVGNTVTIAGTVTANIAISSTAITSGVFSSLTSATLVPGNTARKMATVYNLGAGQLFVNAGATATTLGGGFMVALSSGDYFECGYTTTTLSAIFATAGTASWVSH